MLQAYDRPAILLKKRIRRRCFLLNFAKGYRAPFFTGGLLLEEITNQILLKSVESVCDELFSVQASCQQIYSKTLHDNFQDFRKYFENIVFPEKLLSDCFCCSI